MAINENWKITSRSHTCAHSGVAFNDGETFYTALFEDPKSGELQRRDYSMQSWGQVRKEINPFSFWKSVYEAPRSEAKPEVIEREGAEDLLRRLIEEDNIGTENTRYILAVMLERKRILKQTGTRDTEDATFLIYENPKSGEVLFIRDPELRLDQVEAVQREVVIMLGYGPKGESAPEESPPAQVETSVEESAPQAIESEDAPRVDEVEPQIADEAETESAAPQEETPGSDDDSGEDTGHVIGDAEAIMESEDAEPEGHEGGGEDPGNTESEAEGDDAPSGDPAAPDESPVTIRKKAAPRPRREKAPEPVVPDEPAEESVWMPDLADSEEAMEDDPEAPLFQSANPDNEEGGEGGRDASEPEKPVAG